MVQLTRRVVSSLRANPVTTTAPDAYGSVITVTLTPPRFLDTLLYTDVTPGIRARVSGGREGLPCREPVAARADGRRGERAEHLWARSR